MLKIEKTDNGVAFRVRVQPGAAKNQIAGVQGDALKVKISAPPVKGKANKALIHFLADQLGVKRSQVKILSGHTTRIKKIQIVGKSSLENKNSIRYA